MDGVSKRKLEFLTNKGNFISPAFKQKMAMTYWVYLKYKKDGKWQLIDIRDHISEIPKGFNLKSGIERIKLLEGLL